MNYFFIVRTIIHDYLFGFYWSNGKKKLCTSLIKEKNLDISNPYWFQEQKQHNQNNFSFFCRFPFYYEVKILLLIWLISPVSRGSLGSSIIYRKFVHPALMKREDVSDFLLILRQDIIAKVERNFVLSMKEKI